MPHPTSWPSLPMTRRVPAILSAAAVATILAAAAGAAAFGIQSAVLQRPTHADLVTARALRWLVRYRLVTGVGSINGRHHVRSACVVGWFRSPEQAVTHRGAVLVRSDGLRAVALVGRIYTLSRAGGTRPSLTDFEAAGCARVLAYHLGLLLARRREIAIATVRADGRPAYRLTFRVRDGDVALLVDRRTAIPLAIRIVRDSAVRASTDFELTRLTPAEEGALLRPATAALRKHGDRDRT
jgi:hypothetical protein